MENKIKKKSINTVIYLLLAAMLICVVFVSVYTVASKRSAPVGTPVETTQVSKPVETNVSKPSSVTPDTAAADTDAAASAPAESGEAVGAAVPPAETDAAEPVSVELHYFVLPVNGTPAKEFQIDIPVYSLTMNDYRAHTGVDISAPVGSDVVAASSGTVCRIWNDPMMGRSITIDHGDGIFTTYMNLADELLDTIEVGTKVAMGQSIGSVGDSSLAEIAEEPHIHLEMKVNSQYVDPLEYIGVSESESQYAE